MKVVLIIYVCKYTIYFSFESIISINDNHWCFKGAVKINRKRSKIQSSKNQSPQGVVDFSEGGGPTFVSCWFNGY